MNIRTILDMLDLGYNIPFKSNFRKKSNFEKIQQMMKMHAKLLSLQVLKVNIHPARWSSITVLGCSRCIQVATRS